MEVVGDGRMARSIVEVMTDPQLVKAAWQASRTNDTLLAEAVADEALGRGRDDIAYVSLKPFNRPHGVLEGMGLAPEENGEGGSE